jgi:hypothetical protein
MAKPSKPRGKVWPPKATGRPTLYSPELGDRICALIAEGQSLRSITQMDGMPKAETVYGWLRTDPAFADMYARARVDGADAMSDDIIHIADDPTLDPNDKRVRVDARKWIAAKLKPRKYGDKLDVSADVKGDITVSWKE